MSVANRRHIVLVSCVKSKQKRAARAAELYVSDWFQSAMAFARSLDPDAIFILSAKYGVLRLDEHVEPYEVTLNQMRVHERRQWAKRVLGQLRKHSDLDRDRFTVLAGQRYREFLVPSLRDVCVPMQGLRQGEQLRYLKEQVRFAHAEPPDLRKEFISIQREQGGIVIAVREIHWDGPHSPREHWVVYRELALHTPAEDVEAVIATALDDPRYFQSCTRCGERNPIGWMHSETICQSCAERHLGVVY